MRLCRFLIAALILILPAAEARAQGTVSEASVVVGASPFSPVLNGVLADPLFLPPKGKLYGSGSTSINLATSDSSDAAGAPLYARDRHDIGLSHALAYGLTPRFSLHGSLGYSFNFASDTAPSGVVTKSTGRAFDNSAFGASWRAVDQRRHPVVVDRTLNYSPTFFIHDPGLRQAVNASVGVGRAMRDVTVQVIGNATWRPRHRYVTDDGKTDIEQASTIDYTIALRTQFRFSRVLSTDASVNYALNAPRRTIDRANDLSSASDEPATLTLSTGFAYRILRTRFVVGAYYSRQFRGDSRDIGSTPPQTVITRNVSGNVVTGKVYYLLN